MAPMTNITTLSLLLLAGCFACFEVRAQPASNASALPHLEKRGNATQLLLEGKPFLVLGGELNNSSSSSLVYMTRVWPRLAAMHLNTVLAPVSWELIEPEEGKFNFSIVDGLIDGARGNKLRLVFLWFGSWKNTYSSYAPEWVKKNIDRFPRVQTSDGRGTERLSPFSEDNQNADAQAFRALMRHLKQKDGEAHTVMMMQVENEVGVIAEARDHSAAVAAAGKAEYPLPMFVNAALIRPNYQPGQYNSGGPLPHSLDLWRAAAPAIDFFSPDIYFDNFAEWSQKYQRAANPLFVPEAIGGATGVCECFLCHWTITGDWFLRVWN